jgi:hypothetical protein
MGRACSTHDNRLACRHLTENSEGTRSLGSPRLRSECNILEKQVLLAGFIWLRIGNCGGNEPSGSIKCWQFLEWLSDCCLLKKDSVPWS